MPRKTARKRRSARRTGGETGARETSLPEESSAFSNWGRWGEDDERGTANLLTPTYLRAALDHSLSGRVFSLGMVLGPSSPVKGNRPSPIHLMAVDGGDFAALERLETFGYADDVLITPCHASTHIDALSHVISRGHIYNGFSWREVRSSGAAHCSIERVGALVAWAHVLDIAEADRVDELMPDRAIHSEDLERVCREAEISVEPGDAILIRTGSIRRRVNQPRADGPEPGLHVDCVEWIYDHDVSIVGADNSAIEQLTEGQTDMPLHRALISGLGCYLLEFLNLEQVVKERVYSGLLVLAPLRIARGVGSPVNPVLIA